MTVPGAERTGSTPPSGASRRTRRGSRFWLFTPFVLFALVVAAWSGAWMFLRGEAERQIDAALAREAAGGRSWTCSDRQLGGYPFRLQLSCSALSLQTLDGREFDAGPSLAVAQVYRPRHVIFNLGGPVRFRQGAIDFAGEWRLLEGSIRNLGRGDEQISVVAHDPRIAVAGSNTDPVLTEASRIELYARPAPDAPAGSPALDIVVRGDGILAAWLENLLDEQNAGTAARIELQARITEAFDWRSRPATGNLVEQWRLAGGRVQVGLLDIARGDARARISGDLGLDPLRRVEGRVQASVAGLGDVVARLTNATPQTALLLGAIGGGSRRADGEPGLQTLPGLRLQDGRIFVGPFPLPRVELLPLY